MGGKVLIPTNMFIHTLNAARLAADVLDVPTILCARTDARGATLLTSDIDDRDKEFVTGEQHPRRVLRRSGRLRRRCRQGSGLRPLRRPAVVRDL